MIEPLKYPPPVGGKRSITEAIAYATAAFEEALQSCHDMPQRERFEAAIMAWRCCLPQLEDLDSIKAFIACIATGQARRWLNAEEAKALTYTAQLALTAWQENSKARKCNYPKGRCA